MQPPQLPSPREKFEPRKKNLYSYLQNLSHPNHNTNTRGWCKKEGVVYSLLSRPSPPPFSRSRKKSPRHCDDDLPLSRHKNKTTLFSSPPSSPSSQPQKLRGNNSSSNWTSPKNNEGMSSEGEVLTDVGRYFLLLIRDDTNN